MSQRDKYSPRGSPGLTSLGLGVVRAEEVTWQGGWEVPLQGDADRASGMPVHPPLSLLPPNPMTFPSPHIHLLSMSNEESASNLK